MEKRLEWGLDVHVGVIIVATSIEHGELYCTASGTLLDPKPHPDSYIKVIFK